jgi:enoyl-[acyl-carrier protein] reductase II
MAVGAGTNKRGILEGDIDNGTVMVGQSLNVLNDVLSCQEVMDRLVAEAKAAIERVKAIEF